MCLTRKQRAVIVRLFERCTVGQALEMERVPPGLFLSWMHHEQFKDAMEAVRQGFMFDGRLLVSHAATHAAVRLKELCSDAKAETARKTCLDILSGKFLPTSCPPTGPESAPEGAPSEAAPLRPLSPAESARMLAALAEGGSDGGPAGD